MSTLLEMRNPAWWSDPWWEDDFYQRECGLSLEQIRASIEDLKKLFDDQWVKAAFEAGPPNVIISILYGGKGLWPFQNLMWLSRIAAAVAGIPGLRHPLQNLVGKKSKAALLELEVASWFVEKAWQVEFLKPNSKHKMPDLKVQKNGIAAAIECKRFEPEKWEGWEEQLTWTIIDRLNKQQSINSPCFDVIYEPRLSDLIPEDEKIRAAVRDELAERIAKAAFEACISAPPRSVSVPGIAEIKPRPDIQGIGPHEVGGIEISPQGKTRRIVQKGVLTAAEQLKDLGPGGVVIKSDFTPPKELLDAALCAVNRANESHLSSVAVVAITASPGAPAVIWKNPALAHHPVTVALTATLSELLLTP